jgi:hypothetical protein
MVNKYVTAAVFFGLVLGSLFSQTNPFYVDNYSNPGPRHWMLTGYDDSISGYWNLVQPLPAALLGVNAYYWSQNDKVFICGGIDQQGVPQTSCRWYNISNNTYENAASLPMGRWSGKLLRVRDSLYLIGSIDSTFNTADGIIYKYSLNQNTWVVKDTMPAPLVHECAAVVINDSLIVTIGGSTSSFIGAVNRVRVYNPRRNEWTSSPTPFPVINTTAHAECLKTDTTYNIIVLGGYGGGVLNTVYKGRVTLRNSDSISVAWDNFDTLGTGLFGQGVYRVAGAGWNGLGLFGPAMIGADAVNQIYALKLLDDNDHLWYRLDPKTIDTAGNISTYGAKTGVDSNYLFLFGGFKNPNTVSSAQKYSFGTPPIGIVHNGGEIPREYMLGQNYPNPFNPKTHFEFKISNSGFVNITVYDLLGREIAMIVNENLSAGTYTAEWDGSNHPSGIYFYRLQSGEYTETKKMIFIK